MERKSESRDLRPSKMYLLERGGGCGLGDQGAASQCLGRKLGASTLVGSQEQRAAQEKGSAASLFEHTKIHTYITCMYTCIF